MKSRDKALRTRSYWVNYAHRGRRRVFENEGQLLSSILGRLFLAEKSDAFLGYSDEQSDWSNPHFSNLEFLADAMRSARLLVEKHHEGSLKVYGSNAVARSYRIRRRKPLEVELARSDGIVVRDEASLLGAIIRIYILASVGKERLFKLSTDLAMSHRCIEWVAAFAESLGFVAVSYECSEGHLIIEFKKNPKLDLPTLANFEDYVSEKEWKLLQYYLSKARRTGGEQCEACGRVRRDIERFYDIVTLAVYEAHSAGCILLAFRGQTSSDIGRAAELISGKVLYENDKDGLIAVPPDSSIGEAKFSSEDFVLARTLFDRVPRRNRHSLNGHSFIRGQLDETQSDNTHERSVPIEMTCLGGGQEIGANSYLVSIGDRRLLLDCGADVSERSTNPLGYPYFERIPNLDLIILSHAHTDHAMSILTLSKLFPRTPIYCTVETARLLRILLPRLVHDKSRRIMGDEYGFFGGLECSWSPQFEKMLRPIESDARVPVPGLPGVFVSLIKAGHVLGAAMIVIDVGGFRIVYSGDFCLRDQLTVKGCNIGQVPCSNVLITETTYYGGERTVIPDINEIIKDFSEKCRDTIQEKGVVLLPCFSLGKAQEVLAIAGEAIRSNMIPGMSQSNVFVRGLAIPLLMEYANSLADRKTIADSMILAHSISKTPDNRRYEPENDKFEGPRMEIATHGMMIPETLSNRIASRIIGRSDCSIIITGFQPPNSLGGALRRVSGYASIHTSRPFSIYHSGTEDWPSKILRARIDEIGISSHATADEIEKLVEKVNPQILVAVHGESGNAVNLVDWSSSRDSVSAAHGPVNLEPLKLGAVSISSEAIEEWKKAPVQTADFSSLGFESESMHIEADETDYGFLMSCQEDRDCSISDDGQSIDVDINPSISGYASIVLELRLPEDWEKLSSFEVLQETQKGSVLVKSIGDVDRQLASRYGYVLRLPPGRYSVKGRIGYIESVQSITVRLDIESLIDDWEFDLQNRMVGKISMLRKHLDSLRAINASRDGERTDSVLVDFEKEPAHVFVELTKRGNPTGKFDLDFVFENGYPDSRVNLSFDTSVRSDEVKYDVDFIAPGTCVSGILSDGSSRIDGVEIDRAESCEIEYKIDDTKTSYSIFCSKAPRLDEQAVMTVKVAVKRSNGYYKHHSKKIRVISALRCETDSFKEMPPSSNQSANFGVTPEIGVGPSSLSGIEAYFGGQQIPVKIIGSMIRVEFKTPSAPCTTELRILGAWRSGIRSEFELASLPLRVGYREEINFEESSLVFSSKSTPVLVVRNLVPYDENRIGKIRESLARFGPRVEASDDSKGIKIFLDSVKDSDFPICEALIDIGYPRRNTTVLNVDRTPLDIVVYSQSARILTGKTNLPAFEDYVGTFVAVIRVEPVLEFKKISRVQEGGFETEKLDPGRYLVRLYHYGRIAIERDFRIPEPEFSIGPNASETRSPFYHDFDSLSAAIDEVYNYYVSTGECLPSIIAMKHEGAGAIIAGDHDRLRSIVQSSLQKIAGASARLWIITPGNFVPKYLSDAIIAHDANWIALSYPCPRTNATESVDDFMRRVIRSKQERVAEIIGIRSIPVGSEGHWQPIMRVSCPHCGDHLHAKYEGGTWESKCACGFSTRRIGYSLDDLEKREPVVIVTQFAMFEFLIKENRKHGTMGRMSRIIGGPLVCANCRTIFPFSSIERIAEVHRQMHTNPGKHKSLLDDGWWNVKWDRSIEMAEKTKLLEKRKCPVCCAGSTEIDAMPETIVGGKAKPVVVMVAGNEILETRGIDAFCVQDHFPETIFPSMCDAKNPYEKVVSMLEYSRNIWRMESRGQG